VHGQLGSHAEAAAQRAREEAEESEEAETIIRVDFQTGKLEFETVREEAFVERSLDVHGGRELPIGMGAARLITMVNALAEKVRDQVRIGGRVSNDPSVYREGLTEQLKKAAKVFYLDPHPGKHTHCLGRTKEWAGDLAKAPCVQKKRAATGQEVMSPDYVYSWLEGCLECPFHSAFEENLRVIDDEIAKVETVAARGPTEKQRAAAKERLARMKARLRDNEKVADTARYG